MQQLKIMEWNINQRAGRNGRKQRIPEWIAAEIIAANPDIAMLVEFYKCSNWLEILNKLGAYNVFFTDNSIEKENDVVIAVKKEFCIKQVQYLKSTNQNDNPNFLRVTMEAAPHVPINIVGVRIRVRGYGKQPKQGDFACKEDFAQAYTAWLQAFINEKRWRRKQNSIILNHIKKIGLPTVIVGDFNNFRKSYVDDIWCLQKIIELYQNTGFFLNPVEGASIYRETSGFAEDHILTKGLQVINQAYHRAFAAAKERKEAYPDGKDFSKVKVPNPDHAILIATILVNES